MIKLSVNSRTGYIVSLQDLRFYSLQLGEMKSSKVGKLKGETICLWKVYGTSSIKKGV